jgi:hypothetical protein
LEVDFAMLGTVPYALEELLKERREGAVRALVRAVGYALAHDGCAEDVGRFLFDSYRLSGEFKRRMRNDGEHNALAFARRHQLERWGICDEVRVWTEPGAYVVESASMLAEHEEVLRFHDATPADMEACMETFWRLAGESLGLDITFTINDANDRTVIRVPGVYTLPDLLDDEPMFTDEALAAARRIALATGITASIGFAKQNGDEPEDLGRFFYQVWEKSGHYDRHRDRHGAGNVLAYVQSLVKARQVLYTTTEVAEDLDGYLISSPSWATEIPQVLGTFGVLPDDIYRYYQGGGVAACIRIGLQYADRSEDRIHRVWVRSR